MQKNKTFFKKTIDFWISVLYNIFTVRKHLTSTQGKMQEGGRNERRNESSRRTCKTD